MRALLDRIYIICICTDARYIYENYLLQLTYFRYLILFGFSLSSKNENIFATSHVDSATFEYSKYFANF